VVEVLNNDTIYGSKSICNNELKRRDKITRMIAEVLRYVGDAAAIIW